MRLPNSGSGPVQGFNSPNIATIASAEAAGFQMLANVSAGAAQAYQEYQQRKLDMESRDAALNMSKGMSEFQEKFAGKDYIPIEDIPESIKISRTRRQVNPDGTVEDVLIDKVPAYEVMPELLKQHQKAMADTNAELISDPDARKQWRDRAQQVLDEDYIRELTRSREMQSKFIEDRTIADIENAVQSGKFELAKELVSGFDNPLLANKANELIAKTEYLDGVERLVLDKNADIDQIELKISELSDPDVAVPLSNQERLAKINALEANKERVMASSLAAMERDRQLTVSNTWLAIDAGDAKVDESVVDSLFENKQIDGGTRTAMIRAIRDVRKTALDAQVGMVELDRIAAAGYGIDPKNKELRRLVDMRYEQQANETGDPWTTATQFMRQYKVVPTQIAGMFRSANRAESPELARAVPLFMEAQDYAPESLNDFSDNDVDVLENVAANVRLGMDLPSAIATTQKWASLTPDEKRTLKDNARKSWDANNAALDDMVSSHPAYDKPWSIRSPEVSGVMRQEFDSLVERVLPTVGFDMAVAQRKAFGRIAKSWSMTDVNGDYKLMKNMPIAPKEDVRSAISSAYKGYLDALKTTGVEYSDSDIKIASDSLTQIQLNRGEKPTYQAFVVLDPETQEIEILPRFEWDPKKIESERKEKILNEARQKRQLEIEKREFEQGIKTGTWREVAELSRARREKLMEQERQAYEDRKNADQ